MPPAMSDDEMSDASDGAVAQPQLSALPKHGRKSGASSFADAASDDNMDGASSDNSTDSKNRGRARSVTQTNGSSAAPAKADKKSAGSSADENDVNDENDEDDEDDGAEEEYEVQEIRGHVFDKNKLRFHVVWKGYPEPADFTWEPEENLAENAAEMLKEYIAKIGGREKLREKPPKGKKRGRPSSVAPAATPNAGPTMKRSRKSEEHPMSRDSPVVDKPFRPPSGSWEDDVVDVEMYRNGEGELVVCLTWKGGQKTQHPAQQTYVRCPQKILRFYESHISFKTDGQ